jgi:hypothetical protein
MGRQLGNNGGYLMRIVEWTETTEDELVVAPDFHDLHPRYHFQ